MLDINTDALDLVQAVVYIRDMDMNILYLNPAAEMATGIANDQARGRKCWEIFGDVARNCLTDCPVDGALQETSSLVQLNGCLVDQDNQHLDVSASITPLVRDGVVVGAMVLLEKFTNLSIQKKSHVATISNLQTELAQRKKIEEELSREKKMFMDGPVVMFQWRNEPGWPVDYVSENISQFGYSPAEFLDGTLLFDDIVVSDDRARLLREIEGFIRAGKSTFSQEYRIIRRDGAVVWVSDFTRMIGDGAGNISHFDGYLQDISDRKNLEASLLENRRQNLEAQVQAQLGHWEFYLPNGPFVGSAEAYRLLGWQGEQTEVNTRKFLRAIHPDDRREFMEIFSAALKKKTSFQTEYRVRRPDGSVIHLRDRCHFHCADDGLSWKCFGTVQDITERKNAWEQLRRSKEMLDKVLNTVPMAISWSDREGHILGCNNFFADYLGFNSPEQLIGLTDRHLPFSPEVAEAYREVDLEVLRTGCAKVYDAEHLQLEDGTLRWLNIAKVPLLDESGTPMGVLGIIADITEHKAMEEALEKRVLALTMPLDDPKHLEFEDLFNLEDVQRLQDTFSRATGVAGVITRPDGTAITAPSNFCKLCFEVIRKTEIGRARCKLSDSRLGRLGELEPEICPCKSAGLWSAGVAISVGGKQLASWLIGQVRNEYQSEEQIRSYAREIGADEEEMAKAFYEVPVMPRDQFAQVCQALFTMAQYLSTLAYQNVQQARHITQRKMVEQELLSSQNKIEENQMKLSLAVSLARMGQWEGTFYSPKEGSFTFNDQFYAVYGTSAEQEGGNTMPMEVYAREFVHPEDAWIIADEVNRIFAAKTNDFIRHVEHRIIRRDGEVRYIAVRYRIIRNDPGEPIKSFGVNQDITESKLAEEKLLKAKQEAEAASRAKSVFLANMSHEIRTPINGLMGMLQLLQASKLQPEQADYIALAIQSSRRLTRLLSDILDLSRVEAGKMKINAEPFDLRDSLAAIGQLFDPTARGKGLELQIHVDDDVPGAVIGDVLRLQQIISNLVGNAIKFTMHGWVKVVVKRLFLLAEEDSARLLFTVSDTGIGISDETLTKLFTPFTQEEDRYQHQFGGAGLGLAISRQLADLMGGTLDVTSKEGKGSAFNLILTFKFADEPVKSTQETAVDRKLPHLRILLAEDDPISRQVGEQILKNSGLDVQTVRDGQQVLIQLRNDEFDVVLMDVQMPILDGIAATNAIRLGLAGANNTSIPIIAMTACAMAEDKKRFLAAGMNGYVEKPVEIKTLQQEISKVINRGNVGA